MQWPITGEFRKKIRKKTCEKGNQIRDTLPKCEKGKVRFSLAFFPGQP